MSESCKTDGVVVATGRRFPSVTRMLRLVGRATLFSVATRTPIIRERSPGGPWLVSFSLKDASRLYEVGPFGYPNRDPGLHTSGIHRATGRAVSIEFLRSYCRI